MGDFFADFFLGPQITPSGARCFVGGVAARFEPPDDSDIAQGSKGEQSMNDLQIIFGHMPYNCTDLERGKESGPM